MTVPLVRKLQPYQRLFSRWITITQLITRQPLRFQHVPAWPAAPAPTANTTGPRLLHFSFCVYDQVVTRVGFELTRLRMLVIVCAVARAERGVHADLHCCEGGHHHPGHCVHAHAGAVRLSGARLQRAQRPEALRRHDGHLGGVRVRHARPGEVLGPRARGRGEPPPPLDPSRRLGVKP
eukprot:1184337-Prorocentrum_minimum.AAC.1